MYWEMAVETRINRKIASTAVRWSQRCMRKCIHSLLPLAQRGSLNSIFSRWSFLRQYKGLILKKSTNDTRRGTRVKYVLFFQRKLAARAGLDDDHGRPRRTSLSHHGLSNQVSILYPQYKVCRCAGSIVTIANCCVPHTR
jgi:hypothetical protein